MAQMAAAGGTNRTIRERLYLSPRTVQSHLFRIFPKLGITARNQLRDTFAGALAQRQRGADGAPLADETALIASAGPTW